MKNISKAVLLFFLLTCSHAYAQERVQIDPSEGFSQKLEEQSAATNSISCRFVQTKNLAMIQNPVVTTGDFYYLKEGNIALKYDDPQGDEIVMSKGKIKITAGGKTNIVGLNSNAMLRQMNNMLTACLTGDISLLVAGADTRYFDCGNTYIVEIVPSKKQVRQHMSKITLVFDRNDMSLDSMRMDEASGNYTMYEFNGKHLNKPVDESHFKM